MKKIMLALTLTVLFLGCSSGPDTSRVDKITPQQGKEILDQRLNDPDFMLLDVRTKKEYDLERIDGAVNIDFYDGDFKQQLEKLIRDKTYIVYCRSGSQSLNSAAIMDDMGFTDVLDMGGINSWKSAGYRTISTFDPAT